MLNVQMHRMHLARIIKRIYTDPVAGTALGFKGGTAAYMLYGLPRFSVDLDFDLVAETKESKLTKALEKLFGDYEVKDQYSKKYTLFFFLSYGEKDHNIKVEISKRQQASQYNLAEMLGISLRVIQKSSMYAAKLTALTQRSRFANRDVFDVNYFAKNQWEIEAGVIRDYTGLTIPQQIEKVIEILKDKRGINLLSGL